MAREWLIKDILPANELHIVAGPSGAGKTRWLAQAFEQWSKGQPVQGHESYPRPFVYVCRDRGNEDMEETLRGVGVDLVAFPYYSLLDAETKVETVEELIVSLQERRPELKVFIIDGLAMMAPDNFRGIDYQSVSKFACALSRLCHKKEITIIAVMHSPKQHSNERYDNPRQRVSGSVAWAAIANTIFLVEPFSDTDKNQRHRRTLLILPRNAAEESHDIMFDKSGRLVDVPADPKEEQDIKITVSAMDGWLELLPAGAELKMDDLLDAAEDKGISRRSIFRWVESCLERGKLLRVGRGRYQKPFKT
jgi:RecA-family ATPase